MASWRKILAASRAKAASGATLPPGTAGDVDGDGQDDLLIGAVTANGVGNAEGTSGSTYLTEADQLAIYDARDGVVDGIIDLGLIQCFLTGTRIATPDNPRAVETLAPGDPNPDR